MESLQLAQMLANLSDLNAAEPLKTQDKNATTGGDSKASDRRIKFTPPLSRIPSPSPDGGRSVAVAPKSLPAFDSFGRRIFTPPISRQESVGSSVASTNGAPGSPIRLAHDSDIDTASTLMALYEIRSKLRARDNSSMATAREKIAKLAAKQQSQATATGPGGITEARYYTYPRHASHVSLSTMAEPSTTPQDMKPIMSAAKNELQEVPEGDLRHLIPAMNLEPVTAMHEQSEAVSVHDAPTTHATALPRETDSADLASTSPIQISWPPVVYPQSIARPCSDESVAEMPSTNSALETGSLTFVKRVRDSLPAQPDHPSREMSNSHLSRVPYDDVKATSLGTLDPSAGAQDDGEVHQQNNQAAADSGSKKNSPDAQVKLDTSDELVAGQETPTSGNVSYDSNSSDYRSDDADSISVPDAMQRSIMTMIDRVMDEFWALFEQIWDSQPNDGADGGGGTGADPGGAHFPPMSAASPQQVSRKRPLGSDDGEPEEDGGGQFRYTLPPAKALSVEASRFACLFRKHDPLTYNIHTYRVCALSSWDTIHRVKEHLYRAHKMAPHCIRCWRTFASRALLDAHMTVAPSDICEILPRNPPDGISPEQVSQLKSRKRPSQAQSEEAKWRDIYRLLFPNEEVPSPYFEPLEDLGSLSPDSRDLLEYEGFLRREVPRLVRANLERIARSQLQPVEETLVEALPGLIQECQDAAFRNYRDMRRDPAASAAELAEVVPDASLPSNTTAGGSSTSFLDDIFQPPLYSAGNSLGVADVDLWELDNLMPQDSGYGSERLCTSCIGFCSCQQASSSSGMEFK